jgi:hypothetical protein
MHRIGRAPSADHKRFLGLPLAIVGLMLMTAGEASARQCPRGEILRVSKNVCVPKGEKLGASKALSFAPKSEVIEGRVFYGPTVRTKPSQETEPETVDGAPSDKPTEAEPAAYVAAKRPKSPVSPSAPSPSPYGALSLDSFAKP